MLNIISSEFYKIRKSKITLVIAIILLAMNAVSSAACIYLKYFYSGQGATGITGFYNYQGTYGGDIILYISLIFSACLITAEYANGSIRQMACHGIAKWKLVFGQYVAISVSIVAMMFLSGLINFIVGSVLFEVGTVDFSSFALMNLGLLCIFLGLSGFATFLSYLFKNSGVTIAISVLMVLCSSVFSYYAAMLTKNELFETYSLSNMKRTIVDMGSGQEEVLICCLIFFLTGFITVAASCLLFSKRDVD